MGPGTNEDSELLEGRLVSPDNFEEIDEEGVGDLEGVLEDLEGLEDSGELVVDLEILIVIF